MVVLINQWRKTVVAIRRLIVHTPFPPTVTPHPHCPTPAPTRPHTPHPTPPAPHTPVAVGWTVDVGGLVGGH